MDITKWTTFKVRDWLSGICDDPSWLKVENLFKNKIDGKELLLMVPEDLEEIGATKVDLQELIMEAIERLIFYNFNITRETLQTSILRLGCQSRSLQRQLMFERDKVNQARSSTLPTGIKDVILTPAKQRVSLDTLAGVSSIVKTVQNIMDFLNSPAFSSHDDYRSMKSLVLALSIELTSTAQRDQFVENPNDTIEKSLKALADYCDRIVHGTKDTLLIQPFYLETVRIRKSSNESDLGLVVKSSPDRIHVIDKIAPFSPAKKTNRLHEGDEIIQFNQYIVGWSANNVKKLINTTSQSDDIIIMVKKCPVE